MGGNEQVEEQAGDDVGAPVVVTADTDQDAILGQLVVSCSGEAVNHTFCRFTIINRRLETTDACQFGWSAVDARNTHAVRGSSDCGIPSNSASSRSRS